MKIALFLGAGASKQFNMDTTADFKIRLEKIAKDNPNTNRNQQNIPTTFASLVNNPDFKDVEEILQAIKELMEHIPNINSFSHYAKSAWDKLTCPQIPQFNKSMFVQLPSILDSIKTQINNEVFNSYNWDEDNNAQLESFYSKLFQIIGMSSAEIYVGTTNYDQAIENFCLLPNSQYSCNDGFKLHEPNLESIFSMDNFTLANTEDDKKVIKLFKIHGSLNWSKPTDQIFKISKDRSTIKPNERVFVAPTLNPKDGMNNEPFKGLNVLFNDCLHQSQICVIIGYSFRDQHINSNFKRFLENPKHQIIIISPACRSDFVRNYNGIASTTKETDDAWLKNKKPKNVYFLEYKIDKSTGVDVLTKLENKILVINSKTSSQDNS